MIFSSVSDVEEYLAFFHPELKIQYQFFFDFTQFHPDITTYFTLQYQLEFCSDIICQILII